MKWANSLHNLICPIKMKKKHAGTKLLPLPKNLSPFQWTSDHQEAFEKLKLALTTAPVLAYPDYTKPFVLEMDASLKGLGTVLSQEEDDGNFASFPILVICSNHMKDQCVITARLN